MGESLIRTSNPLQHAAELALPVLRDAIAQRGMARLAVPGGSVARISGLLREALGEDWKRVRLTWIDERCVDFDHADSNRGQAYRAGYLSDDDPPLQELPLWLDDETPARAQARVQAKLERDFGNRLDVVVYGLGEDGHLASLFPGHPAMFARDRITHVPDSPKPPPARMTMTFALLRAAGRALLVVSGEAKRAALERVVSGDPELPANILPELTIVTDLDVGEAA